MKNIGSFRDEWLKYFFMDKEPFRLIPTDIESALARKLDIINAAADHRDLRSPPGNKFEHLSGNLTGYCSIRVNSQYRLIFRWENGKAEDLYLDPHKY
ncbi:type II toxin-antitoxin system RelE/ParE family toxin [Scandinavium goeteborgense]|uniref:type II toxin-antitoxin system RelE/ParE family toxin n=1 Tax=Scandinavium goeteborgense TaxID=1851514 RepID=UPI003800FD0D